MSQGHLFLVRSTPVPDDVTAALQSIRDACAGWPRVDVKSLPSGTSTNDPAGLVCNVVANPVGETNGLLYTGAFVGIAIAIFGFLIMKLLRLLPGVVREIRMVMWPSRTSFLLAPALIALAMPAAAQVMTHDAPSNAARILEFGRSIAQAIQQYEQLVSTYNAIAHATDLSGVASALGGVSRTWMPEAGQAIGLLSGSSGSWGTAQRLLDSARRYRPENQDTWTEEMDRREHVTANARAMAEAGMTDAQDRIRKLDILNDRLQAAQDGTEVAAVQGLIAIEQQGLAAHRGQIDQVRLLLAADDRVTAQRAEQGQREAADELVRQTRPIGQAGW